MKYNVFFQLGGHKMQQKVEASNEHHAKAIVADSIIFYKAEIIEENTLKPSQTSNKEKMLKEYDNVNSLFEQFFGGGKFK